MNYLFQSFRSKRRNKPSAAAPADECAATVGSERVCSDRFFGSERLCEGEITTCDIAEATKSMRFSNIRAVSAFRSRKNNDVSAESFSTPKTFDSCEEETRDESTNRRKDECSESSSSLQQSSSLFATSGTKDDQLRLSLLGLPLAGSTTREIERSSVTPTSRLKNESDLMAGGFALNRVRSSSSITMDNVIVPSEDETQREDDVDKGCVVPQRKPKIEWCKVPPATFTVRSHNYRRTQIKVPSPGELYECVAVDFLECPKRLPEMSSRVELSHLLPSDSGHTSGKTWHAPDLFVVTLSVPTDVSNSKGGEDGPCYTIAMYFRMKAETRDILKRITAISVEQSPTAGDEASASTEDCVTVNAIRLFNEWCQKAPQDPSWQARFKFLPGISNLHELGIPSWIGKWSGKPVLIKRCGKTGFLYQHKQTPNVMEMEISLHPFPWMTKKAIAHLIQGASKALALFGFVIEGREETQLPEVLVGLVQLPYVDTNLMVRSQDFFHNPSVRTQSLHVGDIPMEDEE